MIAMLRPTLSFAGFNVLMRDPSRSVSNYRSRGRAACASRHRTFLRVGKPAHYVTNWLLTIEIT